MRRSRALGEAEIAKSCDHEKSVLPPADIRVTFFTGPVRKRNSHVIDAGVAMQLGHLGSKKRAFGEDGIVALAWTLSPIRRGRADGSPPVRSPPENRPAGRPPAAFADRTPEESGLRKHEAAVSVTIEIRLVNAVRNRSVVCRHV